MAPVTLVPCTGRRNAGTSRKEHASRVRRVFHEAGAERAPRAAMAFSKQAQGPRSPSTGRSLPTPAELGDRSFAQTGRQPETFSRATAGAALLPHPFARLGPAALVAGTLALRSHCRRLSDPEHGLDECGACLARFAVRRRVVDAYTRRVLDRHGILPTPASYEHIRSLLEHALAKSAWREPGPKDGESTGPATPGILPLLGGSGGGCRALPIPAPRGARPSALP
jgi:hypothetical protein